MNLRSIETKIAGGGKLNEEEEQYLLTKINDYWENHPDVTHRHPRWKKIMAWVAGYQYLDYHRGKKELMPVKLERQRKLVFNRLKPFVRTVLAKFCTSTPQIGVVPATDEFEDLEASQLADRVVEALSTKFNFDYVRRMSFVWLTLLNRAYVRVFWNPDSRGVIDYTREGPSPDQAVAAELVGIEEASAAPIEMASQGPEALYQEAPPRQPVYEEGDVEMRSVPPFNCRPDPLYSDPHQWRWFVYGEKVDAEALEEQYDLDEGELNEDRTTLLDDAYQVSAQGDSEFEIGQPAEQEDVMGRTVVRKELWTPKIFVEVAGKKILRAEPNRRGKIPFYSYEERLIPVDNYEKGIPFNDSMVKDLIPIQREYNRWMSLISLGLERATKVKVMAGFDTLLSQKQFYDDGGIQVLSYNQAMGQPYQLKLDTLPQFAMQYKQELEREMESGGNVHEASFARLPERASHASGTLVNLLIEQDDQVLDPLVRDMDAMFSEAWTEVLQLVQDNYVTQRILKIVGRDYIDSVVAFQGSDLKGNTDVKVSSPVGLPRSRPLRTEFLMNLYQLGLIPDQKTTLELMEFGQAQKVYQDVLLHERRAMRENLMIEKGQAVDPAVVQSWVYGLDDHSAHLKIHLRLRLSSKFDYLAPEQQQALELHIQTTYEQLAAQMQQQQSSAQEPAGPASQEQPAPAGDGATA